MNVFLILTTEVTEDTEKEIEIELKLRVLRGYISLNTDV
jgi:hypothetical protein